MQKPTWSMRGLQLEAWQKRCRRAGTASVENARQLRNGGSRSSGNQFQLPAEQASARARQLSVL